MIAIKSSALYSALVLTTVAAGGLGFGIARWTATLTVVAAPAERKPLYWYDPMAPAQHFDKPGKSPFMDMQLVPRYADGGSAGTLSGSDVTAEAPAVRVDAAAAQSLGVRLATVTRGTLASAQTVTASVDFNQRDIAIVQSRTAGFVERVYGRAPGDAIGAGAPLADVLVPEWAGAQAEYLAVRRSGDTALASAARQRLRLLGMSEATIAAAEQSGAPSAIVTIAAPRSGVITALDVRQGMTLAAGQTLAQIGGIGTIWLNAAIPETSTANVRVGQAVIARFAALPGQRFSGRVTALLPTTQADSRTITARIELANRGSRLRPGMFASVDLAGSARLALLVPSEAVIRTGARILVMRAEKAGRYQPIEVTVGAENAGMTEITAGLAEGDSIVASGQFLIDSEASLSGVEVTPLAGAAMTPSDQRK